MITASRQPPAKCRVSGVRYRLINFIGMMDLLDAKDYSQNDQIIESTIRSTRAASTQARGGNNT